MSKQVVKFKCEYCGREYDTKEEADECSLNYLRDFPFKEGDIVRINENGLYYAKVEKILNGRCNTVVELDTNNGICLHKVTPDKIGGVEVPKEEFEKRISKLNRFVEDVGILTKKYFGVDLIDDINVKVSPCFDRYHNGQIKIEV